MIFVRQDIIRVVALPARQTDNIGVMQGGQVIAKIIIVVLHDFLSLLHLSLGTCLFVGLPSSLFSLLGVRGVRDLGFSQATSTQIIIGSVDSVNS